MKIFRVGILILCALAMVAAPLLLSAPTHTPIVRANPITPIPTSGFINEDIYLNDDFPVMNITMHEGHYLQRYDWGHMADISITGTSSQFEFTNQIAEIRGRGNSTWRVMGDKRPIRIRFPHETDCMIHLGGGGNGRAMFDSEYAFRNWVLMAHVVDPSFMRNRAAFDLARQMGTMCFVPNSWFVHMYLNGEYRGVFELADRVERRTGRIELNNSTTQRNPHNQEYLLHMSRHPRGVADTPAGSDWFLVGRQRFEIQHPEDDKIYLGSPFNAYVIDFVNRVDSAINSGDEDRIRDMIDIPSFVDVYIVDEFLKNRDSGFSSEWYTIRGRGDTRRLHAGPVWDFDQAAGSTMHFLRGSYGSPWQLWSANQNLWFNRLMRQRWFYDEVATRWAHVSAHYISNTLAMIDYMGTRFAGDTYTGFGRNFARWPEHLLEAPWRIHSRVSPAMHGITTFDGHVEFLSDWLTQRDAFMTYFLTDGFYLLFQTSVWWFALLIIIPGAVLLMCIVLISIARARNRRARISHGSST